MKNKTYKVNLHLLEICNYRCVHCFSHFPGSSILPVSAWKSIVDNCLNSGLVSGFNIAGGEPLLYPDLDDLVRYIVSKGAYASIITNGSLMDNDWIWANSKFYKTIGFSLDSLSEDVMQKIGRTSSFGQTLNRESVQKLFKTIRSASPETQIKVNTVVTSLNADENMRRDMTDAGILPDRWKILRMRVFDDGCFSNEAYQVSDDAFSKYIQRNIGIALKKGLKVYWKEKNGMEYVVEGQMSGSYLFVGPDGCLLDNTKNSSHTPAGNLLKVPFREAFDRLNFSDELYRGRYKAS